METLTGIVFDIKKYSIHDGPGIRTTVFLKGCHLNCAWCHNPEGISPLSEILFFENRCISCLDCVEACPYQAISFVDGQRIHDPDLCQGCGTCADICPAEATTIAGTQMTVAEVVSEIETDVIYYDQSGGGTTFSGGEPLYQVAYLEALLEACKDRGIHTVVDTSGHVPFENIDRIRSLVDLFLYDVKLMDSERHLQNTGVPNQRILNNLVSLGQTGARIIARIPIIPGINDDQDNLDKTGRFLASLGTLQDINILPYHRAATEKYNRMNNTYPLTEIKPPSGDHMAQIAEHLESFGLSVSING